MGRERNIDIAPLQEAFRFTEQTLTQVSKELNTLTVDLPLDDVSIVLCGSGGRGELTEDSDADYLVLVHQLPDPQVLQRVSQAMLEALENATSLKTPGNQGLFAGLTISAELQARVGLGDDTSTNLTRRLLLLTESRSVLSPSVREQTIKRILERYCWDYHKESPSTRSERRGGVPRFLLNDLVRYWRTIAVDFGAKRWNEPAGKSHTRFVKLLHSRKLLFAGSLASLFRTSVAVKRSDPSDAYDTMLEFLQQDADRTPLERLMQLWGHLGEPRRAALATILSRYSEFMAILSSPEERAVLERREDDPEAIALRKRLYASGDEIDEALRIIFFGDELKNFTEAYAVF